VSTTGCKTNEEAAHTRTVRCTNTTQVRSLEEYLSKVRCKWKIKLEIYYSEWREGKRIIVIGVICVGTVWWTTLFLRLEIQGRQVVKQ